MTKFTIIAASIAALYGALAITPAAQAEDGAAPQIKVAAYGYDLSTQAGVAALNAKVQATINTVCSEGYGRGLDDLAIVNSCKSREYGKAALWIHQMRDRQVQVAHR
jgi:UrcA family protein